MPDSVPLFTDASVQFLLLTFVAGVAGLLAAALAIVRLTTEPARAGRRFAVITIALAIVLLPTSVLAHRHTSDLIDATRARQAAAITEAWGLTPTDAEALVTSLHSRNPRPVFVPLDGTRQAVHLFEQDGRLLLVDGDDKAIPIER